MVKAISILGSTGSIGRQTVTVAQRLRLPVRALAAHTDVNRLEEQAHLLNPTLIAVTEESAAAELRRRLAGMNIEILTGPDALTAAATQEECDCVVTALSGAVGLEPTLSAIHAGKRIALANKETLVCAGSLVMREAAGYSAEIIPVDSEHSAIFQCLAGRSRSELRRILLTGSGGPFRGWTVKETERVTPEMALKHPNWSMGPKITVDSATMMNKGLEYIEAMHLFGVRPDDIRILIHPESVVHSMVELSDGAVIAQCGVADMGIPIQYALTYPDRGSAAARSLDFSAVSALHFSDPIYGELPCLRLAMECARSGGSAPTILSAANEVAVAAFLQKKIGYNDIYRLVAAAVEKLSTASAATLEEILAADAAARQCVREKLA